MKTNLRLNLIAVFEKAPEGGYTCGFEEFPDVFSQGETIEEAKANLMDALQLVLEYHRDEARKNEKPSVAREEMEFRVCETSRSRTSFTRTRLPL